MHPRDNISIRFSLVFFYSVKTLKGIVQLLPFRLPQKLPAHADHLHVLAVLRVLLDEVVRDLFLGVVGTTPLVAHPALDLFHG
jgi:hypothetical protein